MKFAILSDIHGNIEALKACIELINEKNVDALIWCGDFVTDMPNGNDVINLIREYKNKYTSYIIKGNREDYIIDYEAGKHPDWKENGRFSNIVRTYNNLSKENLEWIKTLPNELEIKCENKTICVSHKGETSLTGNIQIFGHEHNQFNFIKEGVTYINPGSVGITLDETEDVFAQFIILEITDNMQKIDSYNIKYNHEKTIETLKQIEEYSKNFRWELICERTITDRRDYMLEVISEYDKLRKEKSITNESLELWNDAIKKIMNR